MTVWIGTSGWQYRDWRGRFYPTSVPVARWLEHYAAGFATVESNNAFYRLPERRVFQAWADRTPDDFVMAVKVSRYLTHILRLREPEEAVARFVDRVGGLGRKLGPVLVQLPPQFRCDAERLDATLAEFPPEFRVAVELRHPTWFVDEIRALLSERRAALCLADRRRPVTPLWRTADWTYLRFHEGRATPRPCYGRVSLATWAGRLAEGWGPDADCWVYFNNDPRGCAPRDAARFAGLVAKAGLHPSRVPPVRSLRAG
ncbi:MAG TPA: DUF72 domain-containing protein [Candidatus Limnocylindrales bacterium]|jgi:uncharacterized protein YecE (DUF72 family)